MGRDEESKAQQHLLHSPHEVADITLYNANPLHLRLDITPFAVLYACVASVSFSSWEMMGLALSCVACLHALAILSCTWSLKLKLALRFAKEVNHKKAKYAAIFPKSQFDRAALVPIKMMTTAGIQSEDTKDDTVEKAKTKTKPQKSQCLEYQNQVYLLSKSKDAKLQVSLRQYPVDKFLEVYRSSRGIVDEDALKDAKKRYGANQFVIPLPSFYDLYLEQVQAPMFVFQLFCIALFCLDEYWYLSIFTLIMLLIIEGTVVRTRLSNLQELRRMGPKPTKINVYRARKWKKMNTSDLVPGDLVSLPRSSGSKVVPADVLLLGGSCIVNEAMLTGEAIPQMKESIGPETNSCTIDEVASPRLHILYGGTKIVQATPPPVDFQGVKPPEASCVGFVLRTGFATEQGNLMRTIISNTGRASANTYEMGIFILFLLFFAVCSASYVFVKGLEGGKRKMHKLIVECLLIITTVIPPELPIQLTLAVNNSLLAFRLIRVTCTDPFRIPIAGKLDVCCFDKTGTLTKDEFVVEGVAGLKSKKDLVPAKALSAEFPELAQTLAVCHSLVCLGDGGIIGDPLEFATLKAIRWTLTKSNTAMPLKSKSSLPLKPPPPLQILHRFHFSSALQRMSAVAMVGDSSNSKFVVACKGAPERLKPRFKDLPPDYDAIHQHYANRGSRVLSFGYKYVNDLKPSEISIMSRDDAETNLLFGGFLIVSSPIKEDSPYAIEMLKESAHHVVMVTGDNALTACHVAQELKIAMKEVLVLTASDPDVASSSEWFWENPTKQVHVKFSADKQELQSLYKKYDLCVTGKSLEFLQRSSSLHHVLPFVTVFARTAPDQKAAVVNAYGRLGLHTLMCGDGTNDVGALKHADVGISLSSRPAALPKRSKHNQFEIQDGSEPPKLGDASIASPFTSKGSSIMAVVDIIRQGRCTLVSTGQMLRIMALNCLVNAYGMSVLYLKGIKFGDFQLTFNALFVASTMFLVSKSMPLQNLAPERPITTVLKPYVLLSIIGQFSVHIFALITLTSMAEEVQPLPEFDPDNEEHKKFSVSLVNSAVYLLLWGMQVTTIFVNYNGEPFMASFFDNIPLKRVVAFSAGFCMFTAFGLSSGLNEFLELDTTMGEGFKMTLIGFLIVDFIASYSLDLLLRILFPLKATNEISVLQ